MFLGDELTEILECIEQNKGYLTREKTEMEIGVHVLPHFPKDTTDRNRTSPFAFTGNKFEFRMLGSSASIADTNMTLNTIVAEELRQFADTLEKAKDFSAELNTLIRKVIKEHKRIIFNGNNYSPEWITEAEDRGLMNLRSTAEALPHFTDPKNVELFTRHSIFTEAEMVSRCEIQLNNYCKTLHIEAIVMLEMAKKEIIPVIVEYMDLLVDTAKKKLAVFPNISCSVEQTLTERLTRILKLIYETSEELEARLTESENFPSAKETAMFYRNTIFILMQQLRLYADEAEAIVSEKIWPYPTYGDLLYSIL